MKQLNNYCLILAAAAALLVSCGNKSNPTSDPEPEPETVTFAKGADLGWITEMETKGYKFYDAIGTQMECTALFKSLGFNSVRHRVWVNPTEGYCNKADLLEKCRRAQKLGMAIMIDFHYSDWWADPAKQNKPAAWESLDVTGLANAVYDHTKDVLQALKAEGISVTWVQVGNEVTNGMLWETCRVSGNNASNFVRCFNNGAQAVKEVYPNAKVILHIDNAWKYETLEWFYRLMGTSGANYDIVGLSLYPSYWDSSIGGYPDWQEKTEKAVNNFNSIHTFTEKPVMLVEFGMPASLPTETKAAIQYILDGTKAWDWFQGIFYWEPESEKSRNGYEYGAFADGKATIALDPFKN